jgi:hypothetical protein
MIQVIPNLLRFNLKGQLTSSDLGDYIKFKCTGEGDDRTCDIDQTNLEVSNIGEFYQPSSDGTIQSYGTVSNFSIVLPPTNA